MAEVTDDKDLQITVDEELLQGTFTDEHDAELMLLLKKG